MPRPTRTWPTRIQLTGTTGGAVFVTLYLIRRSGEPPARFGLGRPRWFDYPIAVAVFALTLAFAWCHVGLQRGLDTTGGYAVYGPRGGLDAGAMVVSLGVATFAEELISRLFLIARLEVLLRSRGKAVFWSAAAFASYHAYQGVAGVIAVFLLGLGMGVLYVQVRRVWPFALGHCLYDRLVVRAAGR